MKWQPAVEDVKTGKVTEAVYEHPFVVRLCHWLNTVSLFVMTASGLQIFRAFPNPTGDPGAQEVRQKLAEALGSLGDEGQKGTIADSIVRTFIVRKSFRISTREKPATSEYPIGFAS
jgi:hypothetical protein